MKQVGFLPNFSAFFDPQGSRSAAEMHRCTGAQHCRPADWLHAAWTYSASFPTQNVTEFVETLVSESQLLLVVPLCFRGHHSLLLFANPFGPGGINARSILHLDSTGMLPDAMC
jgi:hypothetical protein